MNDQAVRVMSVKLKEGISLKTGRQYQIYTATISFIDADGDEVSGRVNLPKSLAETKKGDYLCSYGLAINREGELEVRITELTPISGAKAVPVPVKAA